MRLLVADDEQELARALKAILTHNNYSVDTVYDGQDALDYALVGNYDGILLDIMMPKKSGLEVLKQLRAAHNTTPVLLLTAKSETGDKITGLDFGADDYLTKPFDMGELLARVRAMMRRKSEYMPTCLSFSNIVLDRESYILKTDKGQLRLGNKEFQMMEMLMMNPNRIISTEQFMEKIWGYDSDAEINVVWVYISYLRKKLASIEAETEIKALRGVGYTLEETKNGDDNG